MVRVNINEAFAVNEVMTTVISNKAMTIIVSTIASNEVISAISNEVMTFIITSECISTNKVIITSKGIALNINRS